MTVNEKAEIVDLFKRIRKYGNDMLEVLETGSEEAESYRVKVKVLVKILDDLKQLVPAQIYDAYADFFSVLCNFCIQCENADFLKENVDHMASSLALFGECLDVIIEEYVNKYKICACCGSLVRYIPLSSYYSEMKKNAGDFKESHPETLNKEEYHCPVCYASDRDRLIISFLEELQLRNLRKGKVFYRLHPQER